MLSINRVDRAPQDANAPRVYHDLQAQADQDGRFTFDRVPPGPAQVSVQVKLSENTTTYTQSTPVEVKAGETAEVKIGGQGRPVIGRIVVPDEIKGSVDWSHSHTSFSTKVDVRRPKLPDNWREMDDAAKRAWAKAWEETPEGKAQTAAVQRAKHFTIRVNADGTFRTDDVPAGTYQMMLVLNGPPAGRQQPFGEPIATATHEFTIPEIPGGQSDEPFDVGPVEMKVLRHPKVGDAAPPLSAVTLDGKPLKLSDYKGKYVVAYFEAPWSTTSPADAAKLRAAHARFGADARVAMLDLRFEDRPTDAQKFAAVQPMPWTHAFLGDPSQFKESAEWGLRNLPTTYLIGPDGRIIATEVHPDALESTLATALGGAATPAR
jgi:peroxiredoxin